MIKKQWLTVPVVGTGRADDPYRPELPADGVRVWALAATDRQAALVVVGADTVALATLTGRTGVIPHGNAADAARLPGLIAEARRLGAAADWSPTACDVADEPAAPADEEAA